MIWIRNEQTHDKLKKKFLDPNLTVTFSEAERLLKHLGYEKDNKGIASGSRVGFCRKSDKNSILLHKPHPKNELKTYQKREIIKKLREDGELIWVIMF